MIGLTGAVNGGFIWINEKRLNYFSVHYDTLSIWFYFSGPDKYFKHTFETPKEMEDCVKRIQKESR